jgi:hypothetical protein
VTVVDSIALRTPTPAPSGTVLPTVSPSPTTTLTVTPTGTPAPSATPYAPPTIEFFRASPDTIEAGECTTLEWGAVTNAAAATIDHGIGGVGTPGSRQVCPATSTTYVLTASGPGGVARLSAAITVRAARVDLIVEAIAFVPDPPVQGEDVEVQITLRNVGPGTSGPFDWQWQPGTEPLFSGRVSGGLGAGQATTVTAMWRPANSYTDLPTVAVVDVGDAVPESNEDNNLLQVNVRVVRPGKVTVNLGSQPGLDGYVASGQAASHSEEIRVGNSADAGVVYRGFLSFDTAGIPSGATIQSVELRFQQVALQGDPYSKLGQIVLCHVDYGPELDLGDWDGAAFGLTTLLALPGPGQYLVTDAPLMDWLRQDLASGRARFQVRLQFSAENDGDAEPDYAQMESGDNFFGTGSVPVLSITYIP